MKPIQHFQQDEEKDSTVDKNLRSDFKLGPDAATPTVNSEYSVEFDMLDKIDDQVAE